MASHPDTVRVPTAMNESSCQVVLCQTRRDLAIRNHRTIIYISVIVFLLFAAIGASQKALDE
jgi:hypothetical protein